MKLEILKGRNGRSTYDHFKKKIDKYISWSL